MLHAMTIIALFAAHPLSPARADTVAEIASANPDGYGVRFHDDGSLKYLGGHNLPFSCKLTKGAEAESASALASCFLSEATALLQDASADVPSDTQWLIERTDVEEDGHIFVTVQQYVSGLPVRGGRAVIVVWEGAVIQFQGHLYGQQALDSAVDSAAVPFDESIVELVQMQLGTEAQFVERYYDPKRDTTISRFALGSDGRFVALFDEILHQVVDVIDVADEYDFVSRTAKAYNYSSFNPGS